jgi:transposase
MLYDPAVHRPLVTRFGDADWASVSRAPNSPPETGNRAVVYQSHSCSLLLYLFILTSCVHFADSGYAGEKVTTATLIAVEIVRKNPDQVGFAVNPRCWVVERFFAWIGRNRRLHRQGRWRERAWSLSSASSEARPFPIMPVPGAQQPSRRSADG